MADKVMLVDLDRCIGCYGCEVSCKQEHDLPVGPRWIRVVQVGPREVEGEMHLDFVPTLCFHCDDPPCIAACPVEGALLKREDGLVLIDAEKCTQCMECVEACPWGLIQRNEAESTVGKCDLCFERIDGGHLPACAHNCLGGSIEFLDRSEMEHLTEGKHLWNKGLVYYASSKWELKL